MQKGTLVIGCFNRVNVDVALISSSLDNGFFEGKEIVFSNITLTRPSAPGKVCSMVATGQWHVNGVSSRMTTMSPIWRLIVTLLLHLARTCNCCR